MFKGNKAMVIAVAVLYFLSPLDLLPDILPFVGWVDDTGVVFWAINKCTSTPEQKAIEAKDDVIDVA
jgi:uncharacterized membrane protein YkvA (DUF1232 family)